MSAFFDFLVKWFLIMAKKFYVVWQGRQTGIFTDWTTCKLQVDGFTGARYKSFPTQAEAEAAFSGGANAVRKSASSNGTGAKLSKSTSATTVKTYTQTDIDKMPEHTKIFTDGGCDPNPGKAGSGMAVYREGKVAELWYGLFNPMGTNNTAELNALHQALLMAERELGSGHTVAIYCDSKYSIQCVTQWAVGWEKKGWKKQGGEIKNLDLIKQSFALHQKLKDKIGVYHVNGHVGVEGNELADRMSILAIQATEPKFIQYENVINVPEILAMRAG